LRLSEMDIPSHRALLHGKGRKDRYVGFGHATSRALSAWILRRPAVNNDYVFINRYGGKLVDCTVSQRLKRLTRRAGIARPRLGIHALRHFFALAALRNGADPRTVQEQLGHSDLTMTMNYVSLLAGESVEVARRASPVDHAGLGSGGKSLLR
jgi:integrase/recombinase XerC